MFLLIFPFVYVDLPHIIKYYPLLLVRDLLIVATVLVLLFAAARNKFIITPGKATSV